MLEVLPDIKATHGAPDAGIQVLQYYVTCRIINNLLKLIVAGTNADSIVGATVKSPPFSFNHRDIILYALGGVSLAN